METLRMYKPQRSAGRQRRLASTLASFLVLAGLLLSLVPLSGVSAGPAPANPVAVPAGDRNPEAKVEPLIVETLATAGQTDFFIWLTEKADLSQADRLQTKAEKGKFVFETLRRTAERAQKPLRAYLDRQGIEYQAFYIVNKILIRGGDAALVDALAARADVARITANHTYQLDKPVVSPTRPRAPQALQAVESNLTFINADDVWGAGYTGAGIVLAGNDTGLDVTHPAIAPHYRGCLNPPTCTSWDHNYNWWDATDTYPTAPADGDGHGTHTTGTMVGDDGAGNQIGAAPGAQTIHCKALDDSGTTTIAWATECFEWSLSPWDLSGSNPDPAKAPDAVNNSWAFPSGSVYAFEDEIAALQAAGILVEASAGNSGPTCGSLGSPGDYQNLLTTGSVDHAAAFPGAISAFSSRGPSQLYPGATFPDVMAPGENIRSALPGGGYVALDGTSMAGPHVTGLVALMWQANPTLRGKVALTAQLIADTAAPLTGQTGSNCGGNYTDGPNHDWGHGTIDAQAAVNAALAYGSAGTIIRVTPTGATAGACGGDWSAPCDLQYALNSVAAVGDELWVQAGTYTPGSSGNTGATFLLKSGVAMYGGFAGTETRRADRDFIANMTILSGDLDGSGGHTGADALHVVTASGVDATAMLDGFTITGGNANVGCMPGDGGGGLHSVNGSPTLSNLIFTHNYARQMGGGAYFQFGAPILTHVTFITNTALYGGGASLVGGAAALNQITFTDNTVPGGGGGGLAIEQSGQVTLQDVLFNNNWAVDGGGMQIAFFANPTLNNVTFNNNYAEWKGGGMYVYYYSTPRLNNVTFHQNYAEESGGGLMSNDHSAVTFVNGTLRGNTAGDTGGGFYENHGGYSSFVNVLFNGNHAQGYSGGGAQIAYYSLGSHTTFINTTFTGNTAGVNGGGGIFIAYSSRITLRNSILWGNTTTTGIYRAHQINHFDNPPLNSVIVNNTIQDDFSWGTDITSDNPLFVDADGADNVYGTADDDARLQPGSPVINRGTLAWLPADQTDMDQDGNVTEKIPYALDGRPRLIHGLDLGAYEAGAVWYVDAAGAPANGCTAWPDACPSLQTALGQAASGDEIWVAAGTYTPGASGELTATFQLKSGVNVYGGFNSHGSSRADRDWLTYPTLLSGDLDASGDLSANDAYHVLTGANSARLDGFSITGGRAVGSAPHNLGGGLYNAGSSPTLANLAFIGNTADESGGGMYTAAGSPLLSNVLFSGNSAATGGGLANVGGGSLSLYNVTLSGNTAGVSGGGLYNHSSTLTLRNSVLWGNTAAAQTQMANLTSTVTILYSDIQGAFAGGLWDATLGTDGGGNLDADPLFTDADGADAIYGSLDDNARQQPGSPVINAGSNAQLPADAGDVNGNGDTSETMPYDLDSRPRIEGRVADMGAYETGNAAPTIPPIAAQTTAEDTPTPAIAFTVDDSDTPAALLTVSAQSSNPALVPLSNIALAGTDLARTITLTPTLNQFGQTAITLTVSDGDRTASAAFTLTVTPVNDAPLISDILDHLAAVNAVTSLDFTVGDVDTSLDTLTFSIASSNLSVAPVVNFAVSGTGVTRTLTFTGTNTQGNSAITVTVSDGALTAAASFNMHVFSTAGTRYAITDGLTSGLCNTWGTACTLSQAISVSVSGDEVWVAAGVYKPGPSGARDSTFQLKNGVAVYGGFAGTETDRDARDWTTNVTILSGDLDGSGGRNTNDAYHVVRSNGVDSTTILDGFTITGGNVTYSDPAPTYGGGMVNENGGPTLANLIFSGNGAYNGGGMYNFGSSPALTNVTFRGNAAQGGGSGGGLYNRSNSNATLTNVTFENNTASFNAGGMYNNQSNTSLTNVLFIGNRADGRGGAMLIESSGSTLQNVSFIGNSAYWGGGALYTWGSSATPALTNCILWGNTTTTGGSPQIYNDNSGNPSLTYSDIQGGYPGTGNVDVDPFFVDADGADNVYGTADDDARLAANSPLIDLGHPTQCPATDIRGLPRNDLRCDMGAYEVQLSDTTSVSKTVTGAGTYTFGPTLAQIEVTDTGGCLTGLQVERVAGDHPNATAPLQTGAYWAITSTGCTSGFTTTLTLPFAAAGAASRLCRWLEGTGSGYGWDCDDATASHTTFVANSWVIRSHVTGFSEWVVGNDVGPTAVQLNNLTAQGFAPLLAGLLALGGAAFVFWWRRR